MKCVQYNVKLVLCRLYIYHCRLRAYSEKCEPTPVLSLFLLSLQVNRTHCGASYVVLSAGLSQCSGDNAPSVPACEKIHRKQPALHPPRKIQWLQLLPPSSPLSFLPS